MNSSTMVKLFLVFLLSLLSFSVGTFVGKSFSDSQHKMAELETSGLDERTTASIPTDSAKVSPNQAIPTEEEISKLADEFVKKEKVEQPGTLKGKVVAQEAKKEEKSVEKKKVTVHDEITNVSKKIASGQVVKESSMTPRAPTSLPQDTANSTIGKFTVQVSSYASEGEAKAQAEVLKNKGFSAFYVTAQVNAKTYYRVVVGLFATKKEASDYKEKLMKEAGVKTALIQKIEATSVSRYSAASKK